MKHRGIFITQFDKDRLSGLIGVAKAHRGRSKQDLQSLRDLEGELARAMIVPPQDVPADVVTMNSQVLLRDEDTSEEMTYTLVFPADADIDAGKISVLAPVGTAILGYRVGDVVEWQVPAGRRRLSVRKILYQPEAAGDFDL
ncbi:MAG: nucleoside diphosphate kinase regulator [Candidatus Eisenbacteria bacterium]|uniref:Nucleoside diphosphate kinase regulator n=1 Tax=Eiseniibacteriota bacterium TaxID=2212470 RepID=A0A938BRR1_UNCEI|nr:nucleoside diphosphate kinase regulator [Candidatus Eisenbacteria bacterium]